MSKCNNCGTAIDNGVLCAYCWNNLKDEMDAEREVKRFELIKAALTGLLANTDITTHSCDAFAEFAIEQADAVLAELERKP